MSTETGPWMPMYWGDYFGDTMHLTTEEHGAYLLLIGTYWQRGKPLPDDDIFLATVTKLTKFRWKNFRKKLSALFEIVEEESGTVWRHKRLEKEMLKSSARLASARAAGKAGGLASGQAKRKLPTPTPTPTPTVEIERRTSQDMATGEAEDQNQNGGRGTPSARVAPSAQEDPEVAAKVAAAVTKAATNKPARATIDFSKPENRQAYANAKIAEHLGISNGGWAVVMAGNDPEAEGHAKAAKECARIARKLKLTWVKPGGEDERTAA